MPRCNRSAARRRLPLFSNRDPHDLASWVNEIEKKARRRLFLNLCVHRGKLGGAPEIPTTSPLL